MRDIIATLMPNIIIIVSFLAGIIYLMFKDYGKGIYWISGAILNFSVTYLMR